jgi:hypothetical protein
MNMPKQISNHGNGGGQSTRTSARLQAKKTAPPSSQHVVPGQGVAKPKRGKSKADVVRAQLKKVREARVFNQLSSVLLRKDGVCEINSGRMDLRSQVELYNYAFLANRYYEQQKGRKVKIKSTKKLKEAQQSLCAAVRKNNEKLFAALNATLESKNKLFSVVAHVPDDSSTVQGYGIGHTQTPVNISGMGRANDTCWLPLTRQANGLLAQIGQQTTKSSGQPDGGPFITRIEVDGLSPIGLLKVPAWTKALGDEGSYPFRTLDDEPNSLDTSSGQHDGMDDSEDDEEEMDDSEEGEGKGE